MTYREMDWAEADEIANLLVAAQSRLGTAISRILSDKRVQTTAEVATARGYLTQALDKLEAIGSQDARRIP